MTPMPDQDAIQMLKQDHKKAKELLDELTSTQDANKLTELCEQVTQELKIHSKLEEELFYPAFEKESDTKESHVTVLESLEEHGLVDRVLAELAETEPGSPEFKAKASVLKEMVEHHIEEEESEMLPKAQKVMSKTRLNALSEDMVARKEGLQENYEEEIEAQSSKQK